MDGKVLFLLLIFVSACTVFKKNPTKGNPPGTVQINDTLYVDQTEVANIYWREFLHYLLDVEKDEGKYERALPDTLVWRNLLRYCDPIVEYYFRHPAYNIYPVVGVSYEQAMEYCKWRTRVANQGDYFRKNKIKDFKNHLTDKFPIKYYYRLPTEKEWEMIAMGNSSSLQSAFGFDSVYRKWKGKYHKIFNCIYPGESVADSITNELYTTDTRAFYPNSSKCYNMIGNVAEMVAEKGIAKGGSFFHQLDSCRITIDQTYSNPQMWLGFRCVAVKIK